MSLIQTRIHRGGSRISAGTGSVVVNGDGTVSVVGDIILDDNDKVIFDGATGQNYIHESSVNTIRIFTGGGNRVTFNSAGLTVPQGVNIVGVLKTTTVTTLADEDTPSVSASNLFKTGGTTAITDFDDGVVGQTIKIISAHAITITDGAAIILNGSANFVMAAADTLTLTMFDDQVWQEVGRMVNL